MGRIIEIGGAGVLTYADMMLDRPLVEELRNELVVREPAARTLFPQIEPLDYATAMTVALTRVEKGALASSQTDLPLVYLTQEQGMLIERRQKRVNATPAHV